MPSKRTPKRLPPRSKDTPEYLDRGPTLTVLRARFLEFYLADPKFKKELLKLRLSRKTSESFCSRTGLTFEDDMVLDTIKTWCEVGFAPADSAASGSAGGWRLPAREIERIIISGITEAIRDPVNLLNIAGIEITAANIGAASSAQNRISTAINSLVSLKEILTEVRVTRSQIDIDIASETLRLLVGLQGLTVSKNASPKQTLILQTQIRRRGVESRIVLAGPQPASQTRDEKLVRLVAKAHAWFDQLKSGERKSIEEIAASEKLNSGDISRALRLAFLAPSIVEAILGGRQPVDLTAEKLRRMTALPHSWAEQKQALGF